jgi:hypothetical protein
MKHNELFSVAIIAAAFTLNMMMWYSCGSPERACMLFVDEAHVADCIRTPPPENHYSEYRAPTTEYEKWRLLHDAPNNHVTPAPSDGEPYGVVCDANRVCKYNTQDGVYYEYKGQYYQYRPTPP